MKRTVFGKTVSLLLTVALLLTAIPMTEVMTVSAQTTGVKAAASSTVTVSTWDEMRDALQSSEELTVVVEEDTVIEHTFDHQTDHIDSTKITVVGKKTLKLYGEIHFYNGLESGGLFNLTSSDAELTVDGYCGKIVYHLWDEANGVLRRGDIFWLTDGKLTLGGNSFLTVDDQERALDNSTSHRAVIGGTGGEVIVDGAYLKGGTIFGDGIDFIFRNGCLEGGASYAGADLYMTSGSAVFEGCAFLRGVAKADNGTADLSMGEGVVCVDITDETSNADHFEIVYNTQCIFHCFGFAMMVPQMPEYASMCDLGILGIGDVVNFAAQLYSQNTGLGKMLCDYATIEVYKDDKLIYTAETKSDYEQLQYIFTASETGDYEVWFWNRLELNDVKIREELYLYEFTVINQIGFVDMALDKDDMNSLTPLLDGVRATDIKWYEKSRISDTWTENPASLRGGYTYAVEFTLSADRTFRSNYVVAVNGEEATYLGSGTWRYEYVKQGYLTRIEMFDIQLPAPGHHPDFTATKNNPPYSSYEVTWTPYVDGEFLEPMTASDIFEADTYYLLEVTLTADDGFEFDYSTNEAYAMINGENASVFYPERGNHKTITAYTYYHTTYCISQVEVVDVQYPIPGKTPDTDVISGRGVTSVTYSSGSDIDWYYETNPGTLAAGFAKLDGKFKSDRRHQAYVQLETEDGYWFATDNNGNLAVSVTFDGEPMAYAYSTDSYTDDGACNRIEAARTFERAQEVDGVFVDGMWLTDGLYMDNDHWGVQTEGTVDKSVGYAYYKDGVLTLHDFEWTAQGDYNMIDSYKPLTVKLEGTSELNTNNIGIASNNTLTLTGDGTLKLYSDEHGVFAMNDVTVESGTWIIEDTLYEGMWLYTGLTVNGGTLDVYGPNGGLYGDDWPPVTVNGGTVIARADDGYAIGWCDMAIANGATVTVGNTSDGQGATKWDGQTDFLEYSYVEIAFTSEAVSGDVTGDGVVNMMDVMMLYNGVSGKSTLTATQKAAADQNGDGVINMMDVMTLYNKVSGK